MILIYLIENAPPPTLTFPLNSSVLQAYMTHLHGGPVHLTSPYISVTVMKEHTEASRNITPCTHTHSLTSKQ